MTTRSARRVHRSVDEAATRAIVMARERLVPSCSVGRNKATAALRRWNGPVDRHNTAVAYCALRLLSPWRSNLPSSARRRGTRLTGVAAQACLQDVRLGAQRAMRKLVLWLGVALLGIGALAVVASVVMSTMGLSASYNFGDPSKFEFFLVPLWQIGLAIAAVGALCILGTRLLAAPP